MLGLEALYIGTALGIGNFLLLPRLFSLYDFRLVLFFNFLGLLLLGVPLVVGEILWARWLRRSPLEAFRFLGKPYSWTPWISLAALLLITPLYGLEMLRLILAWLDLVTNSTLKPAALLKGWSSFVVGAVLLLAFWLALALSRRRVAQLFLILLVVALLSLGLAFALQFPVYKNLVFLDLAGSTRTFTVSREMFLDVASFSLFTLSAGLGIHFLFTWWASPFRRNQNDLSRYWQTPGRVHRIAIKILLADFAMSLFVALLLLPWISDSSTPSDLGLGFQRYFMEWMPEFFRATDIGLASLKWLFFGLILLGILSMMSLYEAFVHGVQRALGLKRMRAAGLVTAFVAILMLIASVDFFGRPIEKLAFDFMLPVAALLWSLSVGQKLPRRDIAILVGRSPSSDAMSLLWRLALKTWVPLFLIFYLVLRLSTWYGTR